MDYISVKDSPYNAAGNDSTNDTTAIQSAINAAVTAGVPVYFPAGTYKITGNLSISGQIAIYGDSKAFSHLKAYTGCTRMLSFTTGAKVRCHIENLELDGNGAAKSGIYAPDLSHSMFKSLYVASMLADPGNEAGIFVGGTGGTNNVFLDVECSYNFGDGMFLAGVNNSNLLAGCKIFNNGVGLRASSSAQVKVVGTTFENNATAGIFAHGGVSNFDIDNCYFLSNAQNGNPFTTPSITVKADIILNGSSATTMSNVAPCYGVRVSNCYVYPYSSSADAFIAAFGYDSLTVENNYCDTGSGGYLATPIVASHYSTNANVSPALTIGTNYGFGPNINFLATSGILKYDARGILITNVMPGVAGSATSNSAAVSRNHATQDMNTWAEVVVVGSTTWTRSGAWTVNGLIVPVWTLKSTATGASSVFGFSYDAANRADLHNKYVMFGMWARVSTTTNLGANVYVSSAANSTSTAVSTDWTWTYGIFKHPTTGTLNFGAIKHGTSTTGTCDYAMPMLIELGADWNNIQGRIASSQYVWQGTAAPTAGAWNRGDIVWNSSPSASNPPGWMCVTAGTPGTWKAFANLGA
jgi:pectate lyase-like protein